MFKRKQSFGLIAAVAIGAATMATSSVHATTLKKLKFEEMVAASSACVVGEVAGVSYETTDQGTFTLTTFDVKSAAFGAPDATIVVRSPGGRISNSKISVSEVVAGSPRFVLGGEQMLFLAENSSTSDYSVVGFSQGIFPVRETAEGMMIELPAALGGMSDVDNALDRIRVQRAQGNDGGAAQ